MNTDLGHARANTAPIYFPLDQGERAAHLDVNQLLPRDTYERVAEFIQSSVSQKLGRTGTEDEFHDTRGHRAVFIDGDRGTGKTTVAVNLAAYLDSPEAKIKFQHLANDVHVLKPIDPTQLEDNDDLFLNVIVAAVLSDTDIKKGLERLPAKRQLLHEKLQALGDALQGRETQKENYGLDRLRSFMGSQALAYAVHEFFLAALSVLDKRLFVMPIDDVDTSLHKAFDYLEVVRRYLSSMAVLPIVCGDFRLYRDVTQRDSYRRFTVSGRQSEDDAYKITSHLAVEYLRKVLPVQRRVQMPSMATLLEDSRILLLPSNESGSKNRVSLPQFMLWLRAVLEGPVNGHENSSLCIPIPTVRAFSQLVGSIQKHFPVVERILFTSNEPARPSTDLLKRLLRISRGPRAHAETISSGGESRAIILEPDAPLVDEWGQALLEHFKFVPEAGHVCLVLLAAKHWRKSQHYSVLATPLFAPLMADDAPELRHIERNARIAWDKELTGRVPSPWLAQLPERLVIPFATPESGRAVRLVGEPNSLLDKGPTLVAFGPLLLNLVVHRNFYSQGHQGSLLCTGRIVELIATSLVRDVTSDDIERILVESPFHSIAAIAKTKAIAVFSEDENVPSEQEAELPSTAGIDKRVLSALVNLINEWRAEYSVSQLVLSPWLTYCAINKALNQAAFFNKPGVVGTTARRATWHEAFDLALAAFNALWAAFASFEKGPIFGLPLVLSNVNLTVDGDFEQNTLYKQNVSQLVSHAVIRAAEGDQVMSVTKLLATHPLRDLIKSIRDTYARSESIEDATGAKSTPREDLLLALGLSSSMKMLRGDSITKALRTHGSDAKKVGYTILKRFSKYSSELKTELETLERVIKSLT